jgi:hypothetical protein
MPIVEAEILLPSGDKERVLKDTVTGRSWEIVNISDLTDRTIYTTDGKQKIEYEGWSYPGAAEGDPVWKIRKRTYDTDGNELSKIWADGDSNFDNVWTNYAMLVYL